MYRDIGGELTRARNYDGPEECLGVLSLSFSLLSVSVNSARSFVVSSRARRDENARA